ncbi:hypothetical protein BSL78_10870 [Apostichopus japonicus]|uniref:Lysosomal dipeptide transporter MFSD1 n=1 Tax=Stichopus japonicus TaxID=307972 RepID=A0A2G8KW57_STIJA|nr:hypothetical protein BSL78_10870 [Apostichopus japonicus]
MTEKNESERSALLSGRPVTENEEHMTGCGATVCCDPHRALHRYIALCFICLLSFGSYFCYDNPAALQLQIKQTMGIDTQQFMILYSIYSWPNVILCFFGGFLIDRVFGIRLGTLIFSGFLIVGQSLFALGALFQSYLLMVIGRFVFGLGGENLAVCQSTYSVFWFKNREINFVFGLQLSLSRIGSTFNMNIMPVIFNAFGKTADPYFKLSMALWFGYLNIDTDENVAVRGLMDIRASRILKRDALETGEVIRFRDILDFPVSLWLIFIICVTYYVAVFPFISLGPAFIADKFNTTTAYANLIISLVFIISAVASPIIGVIVDYTGRNIFWVALGVLLTLGAHMILAFTFAPPLLAMCIMGVAYSVLACALWPMVAFVTPEHQLGTAYGCMQSIQNLGLAVVAIIAGGVVDSSGYLILEVFFCAWLCGKNTSFTTCRQLMHLIPPPPSSPSH